MKIYADQNVYEATLERVKYCFEQFEQVLVAFSGGKDSGVMLNIAYDYARKNKLLDKLAIYHLDYEAQYEFTTQYVERVFKDFMGVKKYWLCLPISAQCAVNMDSPYWTPWERSKKDLWVREMPQNAEVIHEDNVPFEFNIGDVDYEVQDSFCRWFASEKGTTAVLIGIRTDESYNRFRAIASNKKIYSYEGNCWINGVGDDKTFKCYPIYDWTTEDVWIANGKYGFEYNKLYDLMYQAGLKIHDMRVASPFNDCAVESLKLYKVIEPNTWGKLVSRVNGVSFAGIYGGTTAMGWKSIKKPKHHTWKSYCEFLLSTLEPSVRENYENKLKTSIKFWKEKGGAISEETIEQLRKVEGITNRGNVSKISTKAVITFNDYPDDLDVTNFREVPTYKRMCVCILKGDYFCKYMGFAPTLKEVTRKKIAIEKYKNLL